MPYPATGTEPVSRMSAAPSGSEIEEFKEICYGTLGRAFYSGSGSAVQTVQ